MCERRAPRLVDWVWRFHLVYAGAAIGASLAGLAPLSGLYPLFDGLLAVSLVVLFAAGGRCLRCADLVQRAMFGGFVVFGLFLLIDMAVAHGMLPWTRMPLALGLLAFSVMLLGLSLYTFASTQRAVREMNATLERKVSDRTRDLERSNADLQQFASVISHDLQAPLRLISGHLSLLRRRHSGTLDGSARAEVDGAQAAARRMAAMIQGVLDYARIDSQGAAFRLLDTDATLNDALADLQTEQARVAATIQAQALPPVCGDRTQVRRVFQNLVGNALKYRRPNVPPLIRIDGVRQGDRVVLSVADNGRGIPQEAWPDALTLLRRLGPSSDEEGTGLGLPICKRIVERHGGALWMEETPGGGLTVRFTLPADCQPGDMPGPSAGG
jgi:signal transduction histidine kinase